MKSLVFAVCIAAVLWTAMFSPLTAPHLNFWYSMSASALLLTVLAFIFSRRTFSTLRIDLTDIVLGIGIAAALWFVFMVGNVASAWLFPFAPGQVAGIYDMKAGESSLLLSILLLCIIGPAEELFWRGYVQQTLSTHYGSTRAFLLTTFIYTAIHWASMNFMLLMAALTCGMVWGGLYRLMPHRLGAIVLSHALWDAAVFIWFPIR